VTGEAKKRKGKSSAYQTPLVCVAYVVAIAVFWLPEQKRMVAHLQHTHTDKDSQIYCSNER
jgi:hypothetical protein